MALRTSKPTPKLLESGYVNVQLLEFSDTANFTPFVAAIYDFGPKN